MPLPVCAEAVSGEIVAADTVQWRDVRGEVSVRANALVTGEERRDEYAQQVVLEAKTYPSIRFTIDSVIDVRRSADTVKGTAVGVLHVHGVSKAMSAGLRAWPQSGGLRVLAKFHVPAMSLVDEFKLSRFALDLGVRTGIWYQLHMGIDVVLRAVGSTSGG
jgi:polyisoprenoid-binding protein YceI